MKSMQKILIVEDDKKLRDELEIFLNKKGGFSTCAVCFANRTVQGNLTFYVELQKVRNYVKISNRKHFALLFYNAGGENNMLFVKKSAEELYVQLSDGRVMPLEDLVRDYESLLRKKISKEVVAKAKLEVGKWFRIDREVIKKSKEEIRRKCSEAGIKGETFWQRFEWSNKIADENPDQYPRLIETYIFPHKWEYKTEQEMRDMCRELGEEMCDEIICDLELQMRLCNGESADDLFQKVDKLPRVRVIKLRDGGTGCFGGGTDDIDLAFPPADLLVYFFEPDHKNYKHTPYAFRRVLDQ